MSRKSRMWGLLCHPPIRIRVVLYGVTLLSVIGALVMLAVPWQGSGLAFLAYALFALAAVSLAYTVYILVRFLPEIKQGCASFVERHAFTRHLRRSFGFRTLVFAAVSLAVSVAHAAINGVLGVLERSIWYGALATYYILLALMRGGILISHSKNSTLPERERAWCAARSYRRCGVLLLLLQMALSAAIAQMIFDDRAFTYRMEWMIYAVAAYAFYKIIAGVVNFVRARRQPDIVVEAVRNIHLADACVSILALQTALLSAYRDPEMAVSLFHTLTGSAVSLLTLTLGVLMIRKGGRLQKKMKTERENGE